MSRATIRSATPKDADDLAHVWVDMARYYTSLDPERFRMPQEEGLAAWIMTRLDPSHGHITLVAEHAGHVVGFLEAHLIAPRENAPYQLMREAGKMRLIIDIVGVDRESWGQGVGTDLILAAEEWGRFHGAEIAVVDTYTASPVSVPFYEKMGYRPAQVSYSKPIR